MRLSNLLCIERLFSGQRPHLRMPPAIPLTLSGLDQLSSSREFCELDDADREDGDTGIVANAGLLEQTSGAY